MLCKSIKPNIINSSIISQLIRCSLSIGANYCEADNAESKYDFKHKIGICKKESSESMFFLRMLAIAVPEIKKESEILFNEAEELNKIFNKIFRSIRN